MRLGSWVRLAMKRHLTLVVDYDAVIGCDTSDQICDALDAIADTEVHVVVVVPAGVKVERTLEASWWYLDDDSELTWGALRDYVGGDSILALADPDHHRHLFTSDDPRDVAVAVRGHAAAPGWLSGAQSVREFVRWLIAMRTGFMVRPPRFDHGWA